MPPLPTGTVTKTGPFDKCTMVLYKKSTSCFYNGMNPQLQLFTRAQIATLTGISASALNYWSREGLLIPSEGGGGQGSHRRFDWVQVNIAAVLGELRSFRLNISSLRALAELLQSAARIGADRELHPSNYPVAARLASELARFRSGDPVPVLVHSPFEERPADLSREARGDWLSEKRPAASESEVVSRIVTGGDHDTPEAILAVAERLGAGLEQEANLYAGLVYGVLAPGYSGPYSWLLALNPDDTWRVAFGDGAAFPDAVNSDRPEDFGAAIFVPVSGVIRRVWNLKSDEVFRRERRADFIKARLAAAGIEATVTLGETEDDDFGIDAPGVDAAAIEAVLGEGFATTPAASGAAS